MSEAVEMATTLSTDEVLALFVTSLGALALQTGSTPKEKLEWMVQIVDNEYWEETEREYAKVKARTNGNNGNH